MLKTLSWEIRAQNLAARGWPASLRQGQLGGSLGLSLARVLAL